MDGIEFVCHKSVVKWINSKCNVLHTQILYQQTIVDVIVDAIKENHHNYKCIIGGGQNKTLPSKRITP